MSPSSGDTLPSITSGMTGASCPFMICLTNFIFSLRRKRILEEFPPEYEKGYFKCIVEGCGKTAPNNSQYIAHRGGVHWQGVLDKYLSEEGKDINVDGSWPDQEIKMMEYGPTRNKKPNNTKKQSPVASTPKNGTVKKRGRPPSFNTPEVPCSPTTKKKLKDITVSNFSSHLCSDLFT